MQTSKLLSALFSKLTGISKSQKKFLSEMIVIILALRGRVNFTNMSRYSSYHESSMRRQYRKDFNFAGFNQEVIKMTTTSELIGLFDCSFISKAGKHTYGKDTFWNGCQQRAKTGLEISLISLLEVESKQAYSLDVVQTPANLATKEGQGYSRIDFYLEQLSDILPACALVKYWIGDGYYAKEKVFALLEKESRYFITKLRSDANLRYLALPKQRKGDKGPFCKYDGKVYFDDLQKWQYEGTDEQHGHIGIYSQLVYHWQLKRKLKVVFLLDTKTNKYVLLTSTHLTQPARQILEYYRLRFRIEFIFRDAKQFCGLAHCQARSQDSLDFHFNLSCSALNVARAEMKLYQSASSMNSYVRKAYNERFARLLIENLAFEPQLDFYQQPAWKQLMNLGTMAA
jgi:hypothetical protein